MAIDAANHEFGKNNSVKIIVFFTSGNFNLSSTFETRKFAHENNITIIFVTYDNSTNSNIEFASERKYSFKFGDSQKLRCIKDNLPYNSINLPFYTSAFENSTYRVNFYDKPNYHYTKTNKNQNLKVTINVLSKQNLSNFINITVSYSDNSTTGLSSDIILSTNSSNINEYKFEFILNKECLDCAGNKFSYINVFSSGLEYSIYSSNCTDCIQGAYVYVIETFSLLWLWILLIILGFILIVLLGLLFWRMKKRSLVVNQEPTNYISMNL